MSCIAQLLTSIVAVFVKAYCIVTLMERYGTLRFSGFTFKNAKDLTFIVNYPSLWIIIFLLMMNFFFIIIIMFMKD